jgi:hypothetical protein
MSSIYSVVEEIQSILMLFDYTVYDVVEWDNKKVIEQDDADFPIIFIDENDETNDLDDVTLGYLNQTSTVSLNVVLATGKENWREDVNTELRNIKDIIYTFICNGNEWITWQYTDSNKRQLANTSSIDNIFGGVQINTIVQYEESEIEGVL